jgi:hypothetical protein
MLLSPPLCRGERVLREILWLGRVVRRRRGVHGLLGRGGGGMYFVGLSRWMYDDGFRGLKLRRFVLRRMMLEVELEL